VDLAEAHAEVGAEFRHWLTERAGQPSEQG
jgi:hypothetical protein